MDYRETVDFLFNQLPAFEVSGPGAYKPGLETAHTLAEAFGRPERDFRAIHVAGTNGKGSTTHMLASVLMEAGYRVGLYTSPHLYDFRERIRVNGEMIDEHSVVDFVERYQGMALDCRPTFFELTTIMAFEYFSRQGVDIAVVETGLGGRLDTTNIITPMVSVITNVSLDHMAQLGDTVEQIAAEKAGIIKPGVPAVIGRADGPVREVFERKGAAVGAPIVFADSSILVTDTPIDFADQNDPEGVSQPSPFPSTLSMVRGRDNAYSRSGAFATDLTGDFQKENIRTVLTVIDTLRSRGLVEGLTDQTVARGLSRVKANTHLMGRWEEYDTDSRHVIMDPGHNEGAWLYTAPMLLEMAKNGELWIVLGFSADKDITGIMASLPAQARYVFVKSATKRGRPASELLELAEKRGLRGHAFDTVAEGVDYAMSSSSIGATIFIGGSFYVLAEVQRK